MRNICFHEITKGGKFMYITLYNLHTSTMKNEIKQYGKLYLE